MLRMGDRVSAGLGCPSACHRCKRRGQLPGMLLRAGWLHVAPGATAVLCLLETWAEVQAEQRRSPMPGRGECGTPAWHRRVLMPRDLFTDVLAPLGWFFSPGGMSWPCPSLKAASAEARAV